MPRQRRLFLKDTPCHVVQRGNNRQACFYHRDDYEFYLTCLGEAAEALDCQIHAYVLMTNHVHLLVTAPNKDALPKMMQAIGRRYVLYLNRRYKRTGTLWEGRYRSSLVQGRDYVLACYRYIEMNPVKAKMVKSPFQYPWSSYGYNGMGNSNAIVTEHDEYTDLGVEIEQRLKRYHEMFNDQSISEKMKMIGPLLSKDQPFGGKLFREEIEKANQVRLNNLATGRPRKR